MLVVISEPVLTSSHDPPFCFFLFLSFISNSTYPSLNESRVETSSPVVRQRFIGMLNII